MYYFMTYVIQSVLKESFVLIKHVTHIFFN